MSLSKQFFLILMAILFLLPCHFSLAQLSKAEKRAWKREKRKLSPEQYKSLVEENQELKSKLDSISVKFHELDHTIQKKESEIQELKSELDNQQRLSAEWERKKKIQESHGTEWDQGVTFKVQLGAFKDFDIGQKSSPDLITEEEEGFSKYILGQFRDYKEADKFKKQLRKMGVKEAWIVPYKEGKRVPLKEVLSEVIP